MLITQKPTSSGRRHQINIDRSELHKGKPEKSLLESGHKKRQGRGFLGHITVRHRGAGVKKKLRIIDWKRKNRDIEGTVIRLEYDPMRSSHLALIYYKDGSKGYILAPQGLAAGDIILAGEKAEIRAGKGAQMVRGAGTAAIIQSKEGKYVTIQLPSKELRLLNAECYATIGQIGNQDWKNRKIGKAGRKRLMGIRPTVRGTAQHPDSHPHGGGEGRSGVGMKYPKTPWGKHALGKKTRKKNHRTNKWIIRDRRVK